VSWLTNYYERENGATPEALARLRSVAPSSLPQSFYDLLQFSNGGRWPAGGGQFSFQLSPAEWIAEGQEFEPRRPGRFHEFLKGFVLIGINGSGVCIGFDVRDREPWPIVEIDTSADEAERVIVVAKDFDAFLDMLGV